MFKAVVQDAHPYPKSGLSVIISLSNTEYYLTPHLYLVSLLRIKGKMLAIL